jgi:RNA polymerase sigma factor (sigma-70 family)
LYRDKITEIDHLNAWIYKVAGRVCLNYQRTRNNEEKRKQHLKYTGTDQTDAYTPAEIMQVQEINKVVQAALGRMNSKRREIYELNRVYGLKPAEIASRLSIPVGTVKNHLSAALKDIRDELTAAGLGIVAMMLLFFKIF